jgi:EAL domain-containing protein (putative c-di-GMP-specific phosphodiesterase class I)
VGAPVTRFKIRPERSDPRVDRPSAGGPLSGAYDDEPKSPPQIAVAPGERTLEPLAVRFDALADQLVRLGALGLILVDATALAEIERLYGARAFRGALDGLAQRVRTRLAREIGEGFLVTAGALAEEHLLVFLPRSVEDRSFYVQELARIAEELRGYVAICLKKIVYPYLPKAPEVPVGSGHVLYRPFQRPETLIRRLVASTLTTAQFELERLRRDRARALTRILFEESIKSVYEPIVRLDDGQPIGYEGLSRGPAGTGLESPQALFAAAERADLEYELDALCRRQALRNARGIEPGMKLFLNILPTSIHHPDFDAARVRDALSGVGIAPRDLVLEISERQAISNFHIFREAIDHFARLGFAIALDDVGTGHSSLEAAMELAPQFLKADMSLVRGIDIDPQRQELLRGLQRLAGRMHAVVIAEGVETAGEREALRALGVELGQGHLFGRGGPIQRAVATHGDA